MIDEEEKVKEMNEILDKLKRVQDKEKKRRRFVLQVGEPPQPIPQPPSPTENVEEEPKPVGLKSQVDLLSQRLDEIVPETPRERKKRERQFSLPGNIKRNLKKLAGKNRLLVLYATNNRAIVPKIANIKDGFIVVDNKPHNVAPDMIFLWKGKYPAVVLPEWDINAMGTKDYYDAVKDGRTSDPVAIAIRMLEVGQSLMKTQVSAKAWVFIGLALIAGMYILFGNA